MNNEIKIVKGPLHQFEKKRSKIIRSVVERTENDFSHSSKTELLEEALFSERVRMRRSARLGFTYSRYLKDKKVWSSVHSGLLKHAGESDIPKIFNRGLTHFADEIGAHFKPKVYEFAVRIVPWGFNWLLNAASLHHFKPWGQQELLQTRMKITGRTESLKKLYNKGTILLVPTHQSNIDSVLIGYIIYLLGLSPFSYGAGLNLFSNPLLSFFMSGLGAYTVDRQKTNVLYKAVLKNYSTQILEEGVHSVFFPGGGRSRSGAIESHPKLGLLGTGLQAQIENLRQSKENPNIYIVPMVVSYDFVLEASSLIEGYLTGIGKHRFLGTLDSEGSLPLFKALKFFWNFFQSNSQVVARVGQALDVFGNPVDDEGRSMGPNGTTIDVRKWLTTQGELRSDSDRDHEYTRELGQRLVTEYYKGNEVLPTHVVAFSFFMSLRKKYPDLDLYRFMRLSIQQRTLPYSQFLDETTKLFETLLELESQGELYLCNELKSMKVEEWVKHGIRHLGLFHDLKVLKVRDDQIYTEDMSLLYYYRNRLSGYGLTLYGDYGRAKRLRGELDEKGFLG